MGIMRDAKGEPVKFDFSKDKTSLDWSDLKVTSLKRSDRPFPTVYEPERSWCELCGEWEITHFARIILLDARDDMPTESGFGVCIQCVSDARRNEALIAVTERSARDGF